MIAISIHEVEVFVRKLYGHLVRKATMYLNLPSLDLGLESLQNAKIAAIQLSLAALRLTSVVGFREFFSSLILPRVNQMHLSWFENVENTPGEIAFVNSNFCAHGVGRQH